MHSASLTNRVLYLRDRANQTTLSEMNLALGTEGNGNCLSTSVRWKPHFSPPTPNLKVTSMVSESSMSLGNRSPTRLPFWSLHKTVTAEKASFSEAGISSQ